VDGAEGIAQLLYDYSGLPSVASEVADAARGVQALIRTHQQVTVALNTIAHLRGLEVAADALRETER
jgi:hypothetical protein